MEILRVKKHNTQKIFIFSLIFGFFLFLLPFISNAAVLIGTHYHFLSVNEPSYVGVYGDEVTDYGDDILNVGNSIYIEGDFRAFAKSIECLPSETNCACATYDAYWTEWSPERIEYRIDGGDWQEIYDSPPPFPEPTIFLNECFTPPPEDPVEGAFNFTADTSGLPEDGSWHELTIRGTSLAASSQEETFLIFNFQKINSSSPQCSDGADNDGDGLTDFPNDPGCDDANDDDETNAANPPALPDLEVSGAALANPPTAIVGQATIFDFAIDNIGAGDSPSADITCRLNGNVFDSGSSDPLDAGETDWSWCQHSGISPAGSYTFQICADEPDDIEEEDENNNCDSFNFNVVNASLPDLDVTSGPSVSSGDLVEGENVKFTATYKNIGNANAGNSKVQFKIDGTSIYTANLGSVSVNQSVSKITGNWSATLGNHTLETCADYQGVVTESNENNNCDSTQITVTSSAADNASISNINLPTTFYPNEIKTISFTVNNTGNTYWYDGNAYQFRRTDSSSGLILDCSVGGTYAHLPYVVHSVPSGHTANNFTATCGLKAPAATGSYPFSMRMRHTGGYSWLEEPSHNNVGTPASTFFFGDSLSDTITVSNPSSHVRVQAKLDGVDWTGPVSYTVLGPSTINGTTVDTDHNNVQAGTWTITYNSGGPAGTTFSGWQGNSTKTVTDGNWITFTMLFSSNGEPDLITSSLIARDIDTSQTGVTFTEGARLQFDAVVLNQGDAGTGSLSILRYIRNGILISDELVNVLNSGQSSNETSDTWISVQGSYTIGACSDNSDDVNESNESNNCRNIIITINPVIPPQTQCDDGTDNDGDTWIDYPDDPDCDDANDDDESGGTGDTQCSDGEDNDSDGFIDGNDPECSDSEDNTEGPIQFEEF